MNDSEWIAKLNVGDIVFATGEYGAVASPTKVLRKTSTMIMVGSGKNYAGEITESRYNIKTGRLIGGDWRSNYLMQDSPELREKWEIEILRRKLQSLIRYLTLPKTK
jgi:hypothetical protein